MAEKTILVCDVCGRTATESVTIKLGRGNFVKDMCSTHINELIAGARRPRRGRPRGAAAPDAPAKRGRPRNVAGKKTTTRRSRTSS